MKAQNLGLVFLVGLASLMSIAVVPGSWWWTELAELAVPFIGVIGAVMIPVLQGWRRYLASLLLFGAIGLMWIRVPERPLAGSTSDLSVVFWNGARANGQKVLDLSAITASQPDLVALVEVDEDWIQVLPSITDEYPYQLVASRPGPDGMALFSKVPLQNGQVHMPAANWDRPVLSADIDLDGKLITVAVVHPPAPFSAFRKRRFDAVVNGLALTQPRRIIVGDFNRTFWMSGFREAVEAWNVRKAGWVWQSWPRQTFPIGIEIDHALVSDGVLVEDFKGLGFGGSDHRMMYLSVEVP